MEDTKDQIAGTPPQKEYYILIVYKQTKTGKSVTGISATNSNQVPSIIPIGPSDIISQNNKKTTSQNNKVTSCNETTGTTSHNTKRTSHNIKGPNCNQIAQSTPCKNILTACHRHTIFYTKRIPERFSVNNTPSGNYISVNPLTPDKKFVNINTRQGSTINNDLRTPDMMLVNINSDRGNSTCIEQLIPAINFADITYDPRNQLSFNPMQKS